MIIYTHIQTNRLEILYLKESKMATKTTNYGLTKPEGSDFYDIGVQRQQDIIDKQRKQMRMGLSS